MDMCEIEAFGLFKFFSCSEKLQARFWKEVGVTMREDQHEGEEPLHFKAGRLWFSRKWNLFCFLFTSHPQRTTFLLLSLH